MGREFVHTFELWADHYDDSVLGGDREYHEVFKNYEQILDVVADQAAGSVLEFGVGTGNLTARLMKRGLKVIGVEPSKKMREKARAKLPRLYVQDGDFLDFCEPPYPIDTIVSSFAFHHLTDMEKEQAIHKYHHLLQNNGKIVFADTLFGKESEKEQVQQWAREHDYFRLLKDLRTEYYPLRATLEEAFRKNHFVAHFKQMNRFAWLIIAEKDDVKGD